MPGLNRICVLLTSAALLIALTEQLEAASANADATAASAASARQAMPVCKEPRCISYHSHCRRCCRFDPCHTQQIVLQVPDSCCCCLVEVPVCIPTCCQGAPSVCSHCGIFGRKVVEYNWCCGYHVKVIFDRCGNVMVHTYGL